MMAYGWKELDNGFKTLLKNGFYVELQVLYKNDDIMIMVEFLRMMLIM